MMTLSTARRGRQGRRALISVLLTVSLLPGLPMATPFAAAQTGYPGAQTNNPSLRSSATKKLVLVGGAALLYYLYRRHQSSAARGAMAGRTSAPNYNAGGASVAGRPQLYRSKNGGVYYRDAQRRPVWLTIPAQGAQIPTDDLRRYAPDYNRYRGPAPAAPRGYTSQPFSEYDPSLMSATGVPAPPRRMSAPSGPAGGRM